MNREDIIKLIKNDGWMMQLLGAVRTLNLPDWYIGAGFIRGKVWDTLHNYSQRTPLPDVDVIYLDKTDFSDQEADKETTKAEIAHEKQLNKLLPGINWSVTNQARMHLFHNDSPYISSEEGLGQWVETATCIGVKLDSENNIVLSTPWGIEDLVNLVLRPTLLDGDKEVFYKRVKGKEWLKKWPKLRMSV
ncbi:MAG: nucleotidyltransferase family protein [bacterium]|nr:nucleotidyltransferase family protein [bacterium]